MFQFFQCYKRPGTKLCCFAVALKQNCLIELGMTVSVLIMFFDVETYILLHWEKKITKMSSCLVSFPLFQ